MLTHTGKFDEACTFSIEKIMYLYMLIRDIKSKYIITISLKATTMESLYYKKYSFIKINDEMKLPK